MVSLCWECPELRYPVTWPFLCLGSASLCINTRSKLLRFPFCQAHSQGTDFPKQRPRSQPTAHPGLVPVPCHRHLQACTQRLPSPGPTCAPQKIHLGPHIPGPRGLSLQLTEKGRHGRDPVSTCILAGRGDRVTRHVCLKHQQEQGHHSAASRDVRHAELKRPLGRAKRGAGPGYGLQPPQ